MKKSFDFSQGAKLIGTTHLFLNFKQFNYLISMRTAGTEKDQNHCDRDLHKLFREDLHFKDIA